MFVLAYLLASCFTVKAVKLQSCRWSDKYTAEHSWGQLEAYSAAKICLMTEVYLKLEENVLFMILFLN